MAARTVVTMAVRKVELKVCWKAGMMVEWKADCSAVKMAEKKVE